jgi:predicted deacylase
MVGTVADVLEIGTERIRPRERRELWLPLGARPDGTPLGLPIVAVNGAAPGPTVAIVAGIHGDEFEGAEGLRRFTRDLDPARLRGRIIAALQANPLAHESFGRVGSTDYLDLNRAFPGKADGFVTQRIAHLLVTEVVERADYLIDLHGGGLAYDLIPYVGFNSTPGSVGEASFRLAQSFGIELLYGSTPFPSVLRLEAARRGIPAVLVEVGGNGRLNPDLVQVVRSGLENASRHLGSLEGEPEELPEIYRVLKAPEAGEFIHAPSGGFLVSEVRVGDEVEEGQVLGRLVDVFGNVLATERALVSGVLVECRTVPVTRTGDWTYAVIPVMATADRGTSLSDLAAALGNA